MTEKMLGALKYLTGQCLTWKKVNGDYFWVDENDNPSGFFSRTIKALEQRGYIMITKDAAGCPVALITASGVDVLEISETSTDEGQDIQEAKGQETEVSIQPVEEPEKEDAFFCNMEDLRAAEQMRMQQKMEEEREWEQSMAVLEELHKEELERGEAAAKKEPEPPKPQVVLLVDSENVGNTWLGLLDKLRIYDELHVFYTDKSPTLTYQTVTDLMSHKNIRQLNWVKCCVGNNALDFQLATELGSMVAEKRILQEYDPYFIIMSKDQGYDPIVHYWASREVHIRRFANASEVESQMRKNKGTPKAEAEPELPAAAHTPPASVKEGKEEEESHPEQKEEEVETVSPLDSVLPLSEKGADEARRVIRGQQAMSVINNMMKSKTWKEKLEDFLRFQTTLEDPKSAAEYLVEMSRLVSVTNEGKYLYAIVAQFGGANGKIIMDEIKRNKFLRINLSNGLIRNVRTRKKNYIMLFLRNNGFLDPDIRSISPLITKPSNVDRENLKRLLLRNHNEVETGKLTTIIEKHLRVIREMS